MNLLFDSSKMPSSLKIPKIIASIVKLFSLVSSKITVLITTKIFTTTISFPIPKRELAMEESSQKKNVFITSIQKEIHVLSYGYSDKKVLLCHGWAGRSTQLFMIANKLLEKGYMVISFDAPSHGKSTGKTSNLMEYITAVEELNNKFGPFEAAVGHSFGGMALINTEAKNKIFKSLVTIGSGDTVTKIIQNFIQNFNLNQSFANKMIDHIEKKWKIKLDKYASSFAAKEITIPTLIVHDVNDGDVDVSCAINIRQNLHNGYLYITKNLGHTKILRNKTVTNKIVNFIIQNS